MITDPLFSIRKGQDSAPVIRRMMEVLFADATTVLDSTYGKGLFWDPKLDRPYSVVGLDMDPRNGAVGGDFRDLPYEDGQFDVVVFDPPYHTDMGRAKPSVMGTRFTTYPTIPLLREAVCGGLAEAWRVARLGIIYKCQDYNHGNQKIWMSFWARDTLGTDPYDVVHLQQPNSMVDPKWENQLSAWTNYASFWAYRHDGPIHRKRRASR